MSSIYIKPGKGLKVRDPQLKDLIPAEGRLVPHTMYWERRLRDKDVVRAEAPAPPPPPPPPPAEEAPTPSADEAPSPGSF